MNKKNQHLTKYGKWACVTGASSGIGRAICQELASIGLNIVAVGRSTERISKLKNELEEKYGVEILQFIYDLGDVNEIKRFLKEVNSYDIGLFIHSAGMESHGEFLNSEEDREVELLQLNVQSTMLLTRYFGGTMKARKKGGILLVSSLTGRFISPYFANYAASKSYVYTLALSLREELRSAKIDVSVLVPGLTETPMFDRIGNDIDWNKTPMKTMTPKEVALIGLSEFPKKGAIIPGKANQITSFLASRVMPSFFGKNNEKMMRAALKN